MKNLTAQVKEPAGTYKNTFGSLCQEALHLIANVLEQLSRHTQIVHELLPSEISNDDDDNIVKFDYCYIAYKCSFSLNIVTSLVLLKS